MECAEFKGVPAFIEGRTYKLNENRTGKSELFIEHDLSEERFFDEYFEPVTSIQSPDADNTERGEFDPNDPQTKEWIEYFTIKANYLSENVGSGELWNRTEFRNKIIDVLTDVADKVQSESIPDTSKDLAKELFEKVRHALVDLNNEHFAQRFCEQYIYAAANPTPPTLLNELRELRDCLHELVHVKQWKDEHGKDEKYLSAQPIAWKNADEMVAKYDAIIQNHEKK